MTITCIKADTNADREYFTVGKSYLILDYLADNGLLVSDNDNVNHYLSADYIGKFFRR